MGFFVKGVLSMLPNSANVSLSLSLSLFVFVIYIHTVYTCTYIYMHIYAIPSFFSQGGETGSSICGKTGNDLRLCFLVKFETHWDWHDVHVGQIEVEVPQIVYEEMAGGTTDISSKKSPSTWGPVFEEKIVEVPTVEVREVIKQVSKPEALGCRFSNCWQLLLESFASILHLFLWSC